MKLIRLFGLLALAFALQATAGAATPEQRIKHREMRLREAIRAGDLTPEEAAVLRQRRLEIRRERLEYWQQLRKQQDSAKTELVLEKTDKTEKATTAEVPNPGPVPRER